MVIDSHCHLHDPVFEDLRGALARAAEHGVWGAVAVGCDEQTNARTLEAAMGNAKTVWPAMGFHPDWVQLGEQDLEQVEAQVAAHHSRLVALGEVGLPWYCLEGATDVAGFMTRPIAFIKSAKLASCSPMLIRFWADGTTLPHYFENKLR